MSSPEQTEAPLPPGGAAGTPHAGLSRRWMLAIVVLAFLFVLMPFLFWRATWFGRPLTGDEITRYLSDREHPQKTQHALSQIADRIVSRDPSLRASARRWYPGVVATSASDHAELRLTSAWVMGQDNSSEDFHVALLKLLKDANPMVRRNAALSLVRFGDPQGHGEIRAMLEPYALRAPAAGRLRHRLKPGESLNPGTLVARIEAGKNIIEVRSEVPGTLSRWLAADGSSVAPGVPVGAIDPSTEEEWEGLRALLLIGEPADLPDVEALARSRGGVPDYVRRQAELTARAIRARHPQ